MEDVHDRPAQRLDRSFAVDASVRAHDEIDRLVTDGVCLRLQSGGRDQLQTLNVFVLPAGRE